MHGIILIIQWFRYIYSDMNEERIIYSYTENVKKTFDLYRKYSKNYIWTGILLIPLILFKQFAATYFPGWVVDIVSIKNSEYLILILIIPAVVAIGIIELLIELLEHKKKLLTEYVSQEVSVDIKKVQLATEYTRLEKKEFQDLVYEAIRCTETWGGKMVLSSLTESLFNLIINIGAYVIFAVLLSTIHPIIAFVLTLAPIIPYILVQRYQKFQFNNKQKWTYVDRAQWYILNAADRLECGKDIRMYSLQNWFLSFFHEVMNIRNQLDKKLLKKKLQADAADITILLIRDGICYIVLLVKICNGQITPGTFIVMFAAISRFSNCINEIVKSLNELKSDCLEINSLHNVLSRLKKSSKSGQQYNMKKNPYIELKGVSYCYEGENSATIQNINLKLKAGEKIALIGANGAGKTTLIKVLCGLYSPTMGEIRIGDLKSSPQNTKEVCSLFSCLFQDINILPYTIIEIVAACSTEKADVERVNECLRQVELFEKINRLPQGIYTKYNKYLNEGGIELSGGEQQKLLLARTLYRSTPIIVLDEPTSALDPLAEEELYKTYYELLKDKTIIFVSHRLSSTRFCDRILFLEGGKIIEDGTFDELMQQKGKYANMFDAQAKYYIGNVYEES